jgi:hypothetical protein
VQILHGDAQERKIILLENSGSFFITNVLNNVRFVLSITPHPCAACSRSLT